LRLIGEDNWTRLGCNRLFPLKTLIAAQPNKFFFKFHLEL